MSLIYAHQTLSHEINITGNCRGFSSEGIMIWNQNSKDDVPWNLKGSFPIFTWYSILLFYGQLKLSPCISIAHKIAWDIFLKSPPLCCVWSCQIKTNRYICANETNQILCGGLLDFICILWGYNIALITTNKHYQKHIID